MTFLASLPSDQRREKEFENELSAIAPDVVATTRIQGYLSDSFAEKNKVTSPSSVRYPMNGAPASALTASVPSGILGKSPMGWEEGKRILKTNCLPLTFVTTVSRVAELLPLLPPGLTVQTAQDAYSYRVRQ